MRPAGGGMIPTRGDGLLTTRQAARRVGVAPGTFRCWASRGFISPRGLDERGYPLYAEPDAVRAEAAVRERGIATTGIDPRRLRRGIARGRVGRVSAGQGR